MKPIDVFMCVLLLLFLSKFLPGREKGLRGGVATFILQVPFTVLSPAENRDEAVLFCVSLVGVRFSVVRFFIVTKPKEGGAESRFSHGAVGYR